MSPRWRARVLPKGVELPNDESGQLIFIEGLAYHRRSERYVEFL